jgi:peptide deformylase
MLIRFAIAATSVATLIFASPSAGAQDNLSISQIEQRLAADGFRVFEIERYSNSVEVKGLDSNGRCTEMHLNPQTGAVLRRESDNDCGDRRRDDDTHHSSSNHHGDGDHHGRRGRR